MLKYTPNPNSVAHFRSPDGTDTGSGPFDPSADWYAVDSSDQELYNSTYSRRYGGVPFNREKHYHPTIASEQLIVVASGVIQYALEHGWKPAGGVFSGSGEISVLGLYDFAFTSPEMQTTAWLEEWKTKRAAEPGWNIPKPVKDTGRPTPNTWPWYLDRIINGHGERFTEWNSPAAVGHQKEIFDLCLAKLRAKRDAGVDIDEVTLTSTHFWVPQPSLLLAALEERTTTTASIVDNSSEVDDDSETIRKSELIDKLRDLIEELR